jgi:hypothetical protein
MSSDQDRSSAIMHWAVYGQKGQASAHRFDPSEWDLQPFSKPVTMPWDISIPRAEVWKLLNGFDPSAMEDKWMVYAEGPDSEGKCIIRMHRSWTGDQIVAVKLQLQVGDDGQVKDDDGKFYEITWESDESVWGTPGEEIAKSTALGICNWVLGMHLT